MIYLIMNVTLLFILEENPQQCKKIWQNPKFTVKQFIENMLLCK